jgi:hypothetical protein
MSFSHCVERSLFCRNILFRRFYVPFPVEIGRISTVSVPEMSLSYFHIYSVMFLQQLCIFYVINRHAPNPNFSSKFGPNGSGSGSETIQRTQEVPIGPKGLSYRGTHRSSRAIL